MTPPTLIGLTGLAGSGKDTVAALLFMLGYQRYAFGDEVRREVADIIERAQLKAAANFPLGIPEEWRLSSFDVLMYSSIEEIWEKPTPGYMRQILQRHGSEYRRAQDPDYWVKQFSERYDLFHLGLGNDARMVVTDVRFLNEADKIHQLGGVVWRITRPGTEQMNHISEIEQNQIEVDAELVNDGSMLDLAEKVRGLLLLL